MAQRTMVATGGIRGLFTGGGDDDRAPLQLATPAEVVVCPRPRRPVRVVPLGVDGFRSRWSLATREEDMEILSKILHGGGDPATANYSGCYGGDELSFFSGSPPVRAGNPLIHDPEFLKKTTTAAPHQPAPSSGLQRRSPSCSSPPAMRVEGFPCRDSKNHHVISARA